MVRCELLPIDAESDNQKHEMKEVQRGLQEKKKSKNQNELVVCRMRTPASVHVFRNRLIKQYGTAHLIFAFRVRFPKNILQHALLSGTVFFFFNPKNVRDLELIYREIFLYI